jgi:hypothetical protein
MDFVKIIALQKSCKTNSRHQNFIQVVIYKLTRITIENNFPSPYKSVIIDRLIYYKKIRFITNKTKFLCKVFLIYLNNLIKKNFSNNIIIKKIYTKLQFIMS